MLNMFEKFDKNLTKEQLFDKKYDRANMTCLSTCTKINQINSKKYFRIITIIKTYCLIFINSPYLQTSYMLFNYTLYHLKKQAIYGFIQVVSKKLKTSTCNIPFLKNTLKSDVRRV